MGEAPWSVIGGRLAACAFAGTNTGKDGVRLLTKAVTLECAAEGIRVNSVHPGTVRTAIWGKVGLGPDDEDAIAASQPMNAWRSPARSPTRSSSSSSTRRAS